MSKLESFLNEYTEHDIGEYDRRIAKLEAIVREQANAIENYLETQKQISLPEEDHCFSSAEFREAQANVIKIIESTSDSRK